MSNTTPIVLEVHICDQRRSYKATFANDDQAADFMQVRRSTHAIREWDDGTVEFAAAPRTYALLWPTCEHGMSEWLCSGPNHFGEPGDPGWR